MKIFFASDHAGVELKSLLIQSLKTTQFSKPLEVIDLGPTTQDSVDYPDFADQLCRELKNKDVDQARGVLICGSGIGMSIRANRYPWIRAALVQSDDLTRLSREHNNSNVLCLGARFAPVHSAQQWIKTFLTTDFSGGRHEKRVEKLSQKISS